MNFRLIRSTFIFLLVLGIYSLFSGLPEAITLNSNDFRGFYTDSLNTKEKTLWTHLENMGISFNQFKELKKAALKTTNQMGKRIKKIKPGINELVQSVLRDFSINPDQIIIVNDTIPAEACMENNILHIDEQKLLKLPEDAQRFVIGHELQHFIHRDDIDPAVIDQMADKLHIPQTKGDNPIKQYYRFGEERADTLCALKNKDYARGYVSFAETILNLYGESSGYHHPKNSERLALAREINQKMIQESRQI